MNNHSDLALSYIEVVPTADPDEALPLVVILHGRGADATDLASIAPLIDHGCRFIFPNAPRPFEMMPGYSVGFSWFDGWPATRESLVASREILQRFIDQLQERYRATDATTVLGGFSQGGLMSLDSGFRRPSPLAAIIVMSGGINEADLPDFKGREHQPTLIVHGTEDDVIPVNVARRTRALLARNGVETEYAEFPMSHAISNESLEVVGEFLGRTLGRS